MIYTYISYIILVYLNIIITSEEDPRSTEYRTQVPLNVKNCFWKEVYVNSMIGLKNIIYISHPYIPPFNNKYQCS